MDRHWVWKSTLGFRSLSLISAPSSCTSFSLDDCLDFRGADCRLVGGLNCCRNGEDETEVGLHERRGRGRDEDQRRTLSVGGLNGCRSLGRRQSWGR
ncbi:unnamed protein product [Linum trigynum]|uniref:Secreted protein n=1 Tax=Linum trigynum TaxID=586398 RepID=A0AAV2DL51_9ROSI